MHDFQSSTKDFIPSNATLTYILNLQNNRWKMLNSIRNEENNQKKWRKLWSRNNRKKVKDNDLVMSKDGKKETNEVFLMRPEWYRWKCRIAKTKSLWYTWCIYFVHPISSSTFNILFSFLHHKNKNKKAHTKSRWNPITHWMVAHFVFWRTRTFPWTPSSHSSY